MMKRIAFVIALLVSTFLLTGCPRYDAVRRLSTEQLRVQEELGKNTKAYFDAIDVLLDQQVLVADFRLDAINDEQVKTLNELLAIALRAEPNPKKHPKLISDSSKKVAAVAADTESKKQKIRDHVKVIKDKHKEIEQAYDEMLKAQKELDRYIQLKKVDEVLAEQTMSIFKVNQAKVTDALDKAAKESAALKNALP